VERIDQFSERNFSQYDFENEYPHFIYKKISAFELNSVQRNLQHDFIDHLVKLSPKAAEDSKKPNRFKLFSLSQVRSDEMLASQAQYEEFKRAEGEKENDNKQFASSSSSSSSYTYSSPAT
jgi:hypothetical protein